MPSLLNADPKAFPRAAREGPGTSVQSQHVQAGGAGGGQDRQGGLARLAWGVVRIVGFLF